MALDHLAADAPLSQINRQTQADRPAADDDDLASGWV